MVGARHKGAPNFSCPAVFKNVRERSTAKSYRLPSVACKVFEKLVINRLVDHLGKCALFPDFRYGFRSFRSTADLLAVVSHRFARDFTRSGATRALGLDISKAFLSFIEFQVEYLAFFCLFSEIDGFE